MLVPGSKKVNSCVDSLPERCLIPKVLVRDSRRTGGLRLTLYEECNIGHPYTKRNRHDNPILVPNGDARGLIELLPLRSGRGERRNRTYTRSTINSEAATKAR
jgi:hypothetical protein